MNLNSLVTGPAKVGFQLTRRVVAIAADQTLQVAGAVQRRLTGDPFADDAPPKVETPPAPPRAATPAARRQTGRPAGATGAKRTAARTRKQGTAAPKRTTDEKRRSSAEPAPARLARERKGRQPAPLGSSEPKTDTAVDDTTITRKVETELFREGFAPKGKISVNTAEGVVYLRGEADTQDRIRELEAKAAAIPEVKRVENLLHLPEAPAPTRADTPEAERRGGDAPEGAGEREWTTRRFNADETTETGEPTPRELAERGEGRQPAPLGATTGKPGGGPAENRESPAAPFPSATPPGDEPA